MESLWDTFDGEFSIPENFERTAPVYKPDENTTLKNKRSGLAKLALEGARTQKQIFTNPQTELICAMLELTNPNAILLGRESYSLTELATRMQADDDEDEVDEAADEVNSCLGSLNETSNTSLQATEDEGVGGYDPTCPSPLKKARVDVQSPFIYENPEAINLDDVIDIDDDDYDDDAHFVSTYEPKSNLEEIVIDDIDDGENDGDDDEDSANDDSCCVEAEYNPTTPEIVDLEQLSDVESSSKSSVPQYHPTSTKITNLRMEQSETPNIEYNPTTTDIINFDQFAADEGQSGSNDVNPLLNYDPSSIENRELSSCETDVVDEDCSIKLHYSPSIVNVPGCDQEERDNKAYHPETVLHVDKAYQP